MIRFNVKASEYKIHKINIPGIALAGRLSRLEHRPAHQNVSGLIPGQGAYGRQLMKKYDEKDIKPQSYKIRSNDHVRKVWGLFKVISNLCDKHEK